MTLHIGGGSNPNKIYLGSQPVSKIYKGSTVVWQAATTSNTITHEGITYTFQNPVTYGYYETGEPWVVGPATLVSITPNQTTDGGRVIHGAQKNPQFNGPTALDSYFSNYDNNEQLTFPVNVVGGDIIIKCISVTPVPSTQSEIRRGIMSSQSALFVRSSAPVGSRAAPAAFGWTGRGVPMDYPVDLDAAVASFPAHDISGHTGVPSYAAIMGAIGKYNFGNTATSSPTWGG